MKPYRIAVAGIVYCLLVFGLAACSALPTKPEPPRVTLVGLTLLSVDLFEQRYQVRLRLKNPNAFDLPIRGLDFRLDINDETFADGVSSTVVTVPAFGEEVVELEVSSSLLQVFRQLQSLEKKPSPSFGYRISGTVAVGPYGQRLPFDYAGQLQLPEADSRDPEKGV